MNDNRKLDYALEFLNNNELYSSDEDQLLNEDVIYSSIREKICIRNDGDTHRPEGFINNPYIKIGDGSNWNNSKNSLRISMKDGEIIYHKDNKGVLEFTSKLADMLNHIMDYNTTNKKYGNMTVYKAFYKEMQLRFPNYIIPVFPKIDFKKCYIKLPDGRKRIVLTGEIIK